jgi:hypothetical protein
MKLQRSPRFALVSQEALAINVDPGHQGRASVEAMDRIASVRSSPHTIRVDNGPDFISKVLNAMDRGEAIRQIVRF